MRIWSKQTARLGAAMIAALILSPAAFASPAIANDMRTVESPGWTIQFTGSNGDVLAQYLSYCSGNFAPFVVSVNRLEWGAEQTCEDPANRPHWIVVRLEETCSWCIVFNVDAEVRSSFQDDYLRVVRVHQAYPCVDLDRRKVRMVVHAYARGGAGTATAISDTALVDCDVD